MNDPNKRIDVNLSSVSWKNLIKFVVILFFDVFASFNTKAIYLLRISLLENLFCLFFSLFLKLLSLKAELLRKQEEVNKFKKPNASDPFSVRSTGHIVKTAKNKRRTHETPKIKRCENSGSSNQTEEDHEMLAKSKRILEAKAKLYEKMTNSGGCMNTDDTCLVQFNRKKQSASQSIHLDSDDSESDDADVTENHFNDDSDQFDSKWIEYTDCLGRTRKCLREDLDFFKSKDRELAAAADHRNNRSDEKEAAPWFIDTKGISSTDLPLCKSTNDDDTMSMISKSSKMEEMRLQWENKEQDNLNREQIHYQDVLFDEARTHGVGYYDFSTNTDERRKQQKILEEERDKTLDQQRKREQVRLMREKMIADRVFAAKNRQRARLGLPALSREEFDAAEKNDKCEREGENNQKQKKKEEKKQKKKEKQEKERNEKRQRHVRPWDHGKDGIDDVSDRSSVFCNEKSSDDEKWEYRPDKPEPMSQKQWNELQRTERNPDFAPPSFESFNRFTTKKPKPMKRRNETAFENMFDEPIRNELDGTDFPLEENDTNKRRRAEIAPPLTFDYFGPGSVSKSKNTNKNPDLCDSIEAGLRFLREKSDKSGPGGKKQSWLANTSYEE